jgi:hypothetical protein
MAEVTERLRQRMATEAGFKDRLIAEVMLQAGVGMDLFDDNGDFKDESSQRAVNAARPRVKGVPLHHLLGLTRAQVVEVVGEDGAEEAAKLVDFAAEPEGDAAARSATTGHLVDGAAVPPPDVTLVTAEGTGHPDADQWSAEQAANLQPPAEEPPAETATPPAAEPEQPSGKGKAATAKA